MIDYDKSSYKNGSSYGGCCVTILVIAFSLIIGFSALADDPPPTPPPCPVGESNTVGSTQDAPIGDGLTCMMVCSMIYLTIKTREL
jgi:hypothetical protein